MTPPDEKPSFTLSEEGRVILTITQDGRFVLGPGATVDEAAQAIVDVASKLWQEQRPAEGEDWKREG